MDRVRYECRLRTGCHEAQFWADDTAAIMTIVEGACRGAQVRDSIKLTVTDTACRNARSNLYAPTCLGFAEAAGNMLNAMEAVKMPPPREGEGRDVVVEVHFAAHGATLTQCKEFARDALDKALLAFTHDASERTPTFSYNGEGVGDAWFL